MLRVYSIRPEKMREGSATFRGYRRASFEDAWARYLPAIPENPEQGEQGNIPLTEQVLMFRVILVFRVAKITWNTTTRMNMAMFRVYRVFRVLGKTGGKGSTISPMRERRALNSGWAANTC